MLDIVDHCFRSNIRIDRCSLSCCLFCEVNTTSFNICPFRYKFLVTKCPTCIYICAVGQAVADWSSTLRPITESQKKNKEMHPKVVDLQKGSTLSWNMLFNWKPLFAYDIVHIVLGWRTAAMLSTFEKQGEVPVLPNEVGYLSNCTILEWQAPLSRW